MVHGRMHRSAVCGTFVCFALGLMLVAVGQARGDEPKMRWIVVCAPRFRPAIQMLKQRRIAQGFSAEVIVTTDALGPSEIAAGDGRRLQARIRQMVGEGSTPACLLLVGCPRAGEGENPQEVVVPGLRGMVGRMRGELSDNGYGLPGADLLPTMAVGRLPARNLAEAQAMVEKIIAYEEEGERAAWRRSITLLVGDPGGAGLVEGTAANWFVSTASASSLQKVDPTWTRRSIVHIPGSPWCVPDSQLHSRSIDVLEEGQALVFYLGHSGAGGLWSGGAPFLSRDNWGSIKAPGVFVTCGCFSCQWDEPGYGIAAMRNPRGPAAVIGASGESYAAMGQLAFGGLVPDLAGPKLPGRLGELWLDVKRGIARGKIDALTFTLLDWGDGTQGRVPLAQQRREHLEMWLLLGDPAMRLPAPPRPITIQVDHPAVPGAKLRIRGRLLQSVDSTVVITIERPAGSWPAGLEKVGAGMDRDRVVLANYARATDVILARGQTEARRGVFDVEIALPREIPWRKVVVRAVATDAGQAIATDVRRAAP